METPIFDHVWQPSKFSKDPFFFGIIEFNVLSTPNTSKRFFAHNWITIMQDTTNSIIKIFLCIYCTKLDWHGARIHQNTAKILTKCKPILSLTKCISFAKYDNFRINYWLHWIKCPIPFLNIPLSCQNSLVSNDTNVAFGLTIR